MVLAMLLIVGIHSLRLHAQTIPEAVAGFRWPLNQSYAGTGSCSGSSFCNNGGYQYLANTNFAYGQSCGNIYHPGQDWNVPGGGGGCNSGCSSDECIPVYAVAIGKVVYANGSVWGGLVIQHNYKGRVWYTQYGHVRDISVSVGQIVTKGQQVAKIGRVGTNCAHLHFEVRENDHPNPTNGTFFCNVGLNSATNVENWYENPSTFLPASSAYGPSLIVPSNNASIARKTNFDWADIAGASNYRIQISTNPSSFSTTNGFSSGLVVNATTGTTSNYLASLAPGTYYWSVRGATNYETSPYTAYRKVVVSSSLVSNTTITPDLSITNPELKVNTETLKISIVPNPAHDFITVSGQVDERYLGTTSLVVTDVTGKVVKTQNSVITSPGVYSEMIDITNIPPGVYVAQVRTRKKIGSAKFVITKN